MKRRKTRWRSTAQPAPILQNSRTYIYGLKDLHTLEPCNILRIIPSIDGWRIIQCCPEYEKQGVVPRVLRRKQS